MSKYITFLVLLWAIPSAYGQEQDTLVLPASMDSKGALRLTLQEALAIGIKNNLAIKIQEEQVTMGRSNLRAQEGSYEPSLSLNLDHNDDVSPPASSLDGAPGSTFQSLSQRWSLALQQKLNVGTSFALSFFNARNKSSLGSAVQPLSYGSNLSVSVEQPLLRGFSLDGRVPRASILQAKFASKKTLEDKRGLIAQEVRRTENAYWNLVQATRSYSVQHASLQNALQQLDLTQRQVKAGILAPSDLIGSESSVAERELALVQADDRLEAAMDALRNALNLPQAQWKRSLLAIDLPKITPNRTTLEQAMQDALKNRHEFRLYALDNEIVSLDARVASNNRLPDLNVGFRYGLAGQGGVYEGSLDQLQGLGARNWGVFVNLAWAPLGRAASANRDSVLTASRIQSLRRQQFLNTLRNEIRASIRALETSRRRVVASEKFRQLAERSLEAERKRFLNGKSRNLDVSVREDSLASARTALISARIEFAKASSDLDLATGLLLERKKIQLSVR